MDNLLVAIGNVLRRARRSRQLTLRDIEAASDGSITGSAVGGWERGERSISLVRFIEIARLYGHAPDQLLREALDELSGPPIGPLVLDLTRLSSLPEGAIDEVGRLAQVIKTQRGDYVSEVLSLRSGDLEVWAGALGTTTEELVEQLFPALSGGGAARYTTT